MSHQGPIVIVCDEKQPALCAVLDAAEIFPLVEVGWVEARRAVAQLKPVLVISAMAEAPNADLDGLAAEIGRMEPYLPLVTVNPLRRLPPNAIPFSQVGGDWSRLVPRIGSALRVRTLHSTVLRRLHDHAALPSIPQIDPLRDATVLLAGRAGAYAALSVAL